MSNLLKQCFVVNSTQGNRIINSNQHMKERMAGEGRLLSEEPEGELTGSADAAEEESLPSYEEEKVKLEQLRKAMIADAQTMANQITSSRARSNYSRNRESSDMKREDSRVNRNCRQ